MFDTTIHAVPIKISCAEAKDEINVPIALSAFRDKSCADSPARGLYYDHCQSDYIDL